MGLATCTCTLRLELHSRVFERRFRAGTGCCCGNVILMLTCVVHVQSNLSVVSAFEQKLAATQNELETLRLRRELNNKVIRFHARLLMCDPRESLFYQHMKRKHH